MAPPGAGLTTTLTPPSLSSPHFRQAHTAARSRVRRARAAPPVGRCDPKRVVVRLSGVRVGGVAAFNIMFNAALSVHPHGYTLHAFSLCVANPENARGGICERGTTTPVPLSLTLATAQPHTGVG